MAKVPKRIGKAQAREEFSSLIESVASGAGAVEITDYGRVAAVLVSDEEYKWLCTCANNATQPKRKARGVVILADDKALDDAAKQLKTDFESSMDKAVRKL
jgi:prevent-host-death family protein